MKCWGDNSYKNTVVPDLEAPKAIAVGGAHSCALDDQGVRCWGGNSSGEISVPKNMVNPIAISPGSAHTCALDETGVKCWGNNEFGQSTVSRDPFNLRSQFKRKLNSQKF